jgi:hypothetical protein
MNYEFLFSAARICNAAVTKRFSALIQNVAHSLQKRPAAAGCASEAFARRVKNDSVARKRPCCISKSFAAPRGSSSQSDGGTRADLQTSDGLQVSDAFQALIKLRLIAR